MESKHVEQGHRYKHKCKIIKNNEENKQIKIPQWLFNVTSHKWYLACGI